MPVTENEKQQPKKQRLPANFGRTYIPVCPVHGVRMRTYKTRDMVRYCKCTVEGCDKKHLQMFDRPTAYLGPFPSPDDAEPT